MIEIAIDADRRAAMTNHHVVLTVFMLLSIYSFDLLTLSRNNESPSKPIDVEIIGAYCFIFEVLWVGTGPSKPSPSLEFGTVFGYRKTCISVKIGRRRR